MTRVCLYNCVYCNYGLLKFNVLLSSLIVHCNSSISLCYLCNTLLISLLTMLHRIDLNKKRQKTAVYSKLKLTTRICSRWHKVYRETTISEGLHIRYFKTSQWLLN